MYTTDVMYVATHLMVECRCKAQLAVSVLVGSQYALNIIIASSSGADFCKCMQPGRL